MVATLAPTAPLVAAAWLQTISELAGIGVSRQLPANGPASWPVDFAITVVVIPTSPDPYVPMRSALLQVDVWGRTPGGVEATRMPPWNHCLALAEAIRDACYGTWAGVLVLPGDYLPARVTDVLCAREPYWPPPDASGLARAITQIQLTYFTNQ